MSNYLEIKKRFDNQDSFIDYVESLDDSSLSEFCRGILYSRHVDYKLYENLKEYFYNKKQLLSQRLYSMFNILYIFQEDRLEKDILNIVKYEEKLFGYLLSGPLGQRVELINNMLEKYVVPSFHKEAIQCYLYSKGIKAGTSINYYKEEKIKVIFLISGQVRGIETAAKSWSDFFDFKNIELDVVISCWENSGQPTKLIDQEYREMWKIESQIF